MKKNLLPVCALAAGLLFGFSACSEDSVSTLDPTVSTTTTDLPSAVLEEFSAKYPSASNVTWTTLDEYYVANFYLTSTRSAGVVTNTTAWFNKTNGNWGMTKTEIPYSALPDAVKTAYEATEYGISGSSWVTDQTVDYLQRPDGSEDIYVIEASKTESGVETEVDLYYTETGVLVKEVIDAENDNDHKEYLPQETATTINEWLAANLPNATIVEIDVEDDGTTEVELINNGWKLDVLFDSSLQWVYTKTEYNRNGLSQIPDVVLTTLRSSTYYTTDYAIDDADKYETRDNGTYYVFELEYGNDQDVKLYIDEQGNLISKPQNGNNTDNAGGTGNAGSVDTTIQAFINEKYPGATILEKEYDDGYLEVEILHEGIRKSVKFNGSNEWVKSDWDVTTLPEAVTAAITTGGYQIADHEFEYEETPTYAWYEVEARKQGVEYELYISPEGEILKAYVD
ncbi:MAG: PepSY-like domain-containing protein [Bacteroides sp.]|nr:PepSY-like domain-containing protein [Bacteroides sp.]